jgi:hypothetical protein
MIQGLTTTPYSIKRSALREALSRPECSDESTIYFTWVKYAIERFDGKHPLNLTTTVVIMPGIQLIQIGREKFEGKNFVKIMKWANARKGLYVKR